jgi:hypothetical protein
VNTVNESIRQRQTADLLSTDDVREETSATLETLKMVAAAQASAPKPSRAEQRRRE